MRVSDFHFDLPGYLIAQRPAQERSASRLLVLDGVTGAISDRQFADLPELLQPGDLLVFNDTRVVKARLYARRPTGGRVEALIERVLGGGRALAHLRPARTQRPGGVLAFEGARATVVERRPDDLFVLQFEPGVNVYELMEQSGEVPLPPYIVREVEHDDVHRYQTVYGRVPGAIAAPTAGLHFDERMFAMLEERGVERCHVTLHVGAGTFLPVRVQDIHQHRMHSEYMEVSDQACRQIHAAHARGRRVVAVGTTSVRALESAAAAGELRPMASDTDIFITPGFRFRVADAMVTNFHLPESTLLMLVCAFAGREKVLQAYQHAVRSRYRFYSYGDAMFVTAERPRHAV
ncbi:MAG: tRNA preQ1(34) S-adenosylmethionine ribosyltransferase-isomerase QueA [Gammaproteobacteria bacterium]